MTRPADPAAQYAATCYRHSNRGTNVYCQNCGKPICPDCMRDTPVGFRCPDCAPRSKPIFDERLIATKVLIAICVAVYLVEVVMELGKGAGAQAFMTTNANDLFNKGALVGQQIASQGGLFGLGGGHQYYRIITSGFLHLGLVHIAFNSFFIYQLGQLIEVAVGKFRFVLIYLVSLIGGAAGALALSAANGATVGASGAGFGLLGAALVMARLRRNEQLASQLLGLAAINFAFTFLLSGISVGGHLGGFATGAFCGWIAYGPLQKYKWAAPAIFVVLGVALFVLAIVAAQSKTNSLYGL